MYAWWKRVRDELDRKGWSVVELERRTGIDKGRLYKYVTGEVSQPRGDAFARMAQAFSVNEWWLRTGDGARSSRLQVIGRLSAGEEWTTLQETVADAKYIDFDLGREDFFAIEVQGASMSPAYRDGDIVICSRRQISDLRNVDPAQFRRRDCAVKTADGRGFLKNVIPGRSEGVFTLRSYNPDYPDIENAALQWIAPVVWIRRSI
ncbi:MAG: S24 family peptidase [Rhodospirillaceae bacterium]